MAFKDFSEVSRLATFNFIIVKDLFSKYLYFSVVILNIGKQDISLEILKKPVTKFIFFFMLFHLYLKLVSSEGSLSVHDEFL